MQRTRNTGDDLDRAFQENFLQKNQTAPSNDVKPETPAAKKITAAPNAAPNETPVSSNDDENEHSISKSVPKSDPFYYTPSPHPADNPDNIKVVDPPPTGESADAELEREVEKYSDLLNEMTRMNREPEDVPAFTALKAKAEKQYRKVKNLIGSSMDYIETNPFADRNGEDMLWSDGTPVRWISPRPQMKDAP